MLTETRTEEIRQLFPVTKNIVPFNHAAVAPIPSTSVEAMTEFITAISNYGDKDYGKWFRKLAEIRAGMARFIGAAADEIAFIKNTSEGLSFVANGLSFQTGDNVVVPEMEFPANIYPWLNLKAKGVKTKFVKCIQGRVPLENIESTIDERTRLVSISSVEFSSGFRNNIKAISALCREKSQQFGRKIYLCVDGIQSMGVLKVDVKKLGIDFFSADGHKWFLTPEGAGIFYCSSDVIEDLHPASVGWKSVINPLDFDDINFDLEQSAKKFEQGSMNLIGIFALGASLDLFNSVGIENIEQRILFLTDTLINTIQEHGYTVTNSLLPAERSGIVTFITEKGIEEVYQTFINNNIQLSLRNGNIRLSPHFYCNEEDIARFTEVLKSL